jgi:hypothetical protein
MTDEPRETNEDQVEVGPVEVTPAEGEQQESHESDETLSPDEQRRP